MNDNIDNKVKKLIVDFYANRDRLEYINLNEKNMYSGWVTDFHICLNNEKNVSLDLKKENELFLLFVLVLAWSRSDRFENAPFLIAHIKSKGLDEIEYWKKDENKLKEIKERKINAKNIEKITTGLIPRKRVSFRSDIFESIYTLAKKWDEIYNSLKSFDSNKDYIGFMEYINKIAGLGYGRNSMFIKIPLILRELRCQNVFENIPGELCCVIDKRVIYACNIIGIEIPTRYNSISYLVNSSKIIYKYFGDLYDIPLFAYEDIYG